METEQLQGITLVHGDCFEMMASLPDECADLVLCDIPYGETNNEWDRKFDVERALSEFMRLSKPRGCVALTGSFRLGCRMMAAIGKYYRYDWVWDKGKGANFPNARCQPLRCHEQVFIFSKAGAAPGSSPAMAYYPQMRPGEPYRVACKKNTGKRITSNFGIVESPECIYGAERFPLTIIPSPREPKPVHPTQKPVALFEYLVRTYTAEGDLVVDPCLGSGTAAVACARSGRRFIGSEIDDFYYAKARERIEMHQRQLKLF